MYTIFKQGSEGSLRLLRTQNRVHSLNDNKYSSTNLGMAIGHSYFTKYISKSIKQFCAQCRYESFRSRLASRNNYADTSRNNHANRNNYAVTRSRVLYASFAEAPSVEVASIHYWLQVELIMRLHI